MDVEKHDHAAASIASAVGEPARARMLYCLLDGRARTSTELAAIADVAPSTASAHLGRLSAEALVEVHAQGRHRYYRLSGPEVAAVLEALSVLAGGALERFEPSTPRRLREARTCYDHLAGSLGVALLDRLVDLGWLTPSRDDERGFDLTPAGIEGLASLRVDVEAARAARRRFAFACLDWSERRPHLAGALGAALLAMALRHGWVSRDLDSRIVTVTRTGRRELGSRLGITL